MSPPPELLVRDGISAESVRLVEPPSRQPAEAQRGETQNGEAKTVSPVVFLPWLFAAVAGSLTTDVLCRLPGGESGWVEWAAAQTLLLTVAASATVFVVLALLRAARPLLQKAAAYGIGNRAAGGWRLVWVTGVVLLLALARRLSLPVFARYYNEQGIRLQYGDHPDIPGARQAYQRALRLMPDYASAHYNLAILAEELDIEKAIAEYLLAIEDDGNFYPAYKNLARLYLLRGKDKDYENALNLLRRATELAPPEAGVQYAINKNLGWANDALKSYAQA